jgi:hypothetical protein
MKSYPAIASLAISLFFVSFTQAAPKEEIEVPVLIDLGLGFGHLVSDVDITSNNQKVYVFKPSLAGTIEAKTIKSLKDKLPKNAPKWLQSTELSYNPFPLPDSIYFTSSDDGSDKVYGVNLGPDLSIGIGTGFLSAGANIGARLTYLYMENDLFDENHFLSLGAVAGYNITLTPFRYFQLEIGQNYSWHIEDELSNGEYLGQMTENYAMLHFRFPYTANVKL